MNALHWAAAKGFSAAADVYQRARPGYPDEAVAWLAERLGIGPGRDVLDLAAGTGKLTRALAPLGARLVAVEPIPEMRAELERALPEVDACEGAAEAIPLADASVDAVACAQAFHWFRHDEALAEIHRVLRPGGGLGLVWNVRDERDPLQARISEILAPHRDDAVGFRRGRWREALERSPLFGPLEHRAWAHLDRISLERLLERVSSTSFVAAMSPAEREAVLEEVRAVASGLGESIAVAYVTEAYVTARR